MPSKRKVKTGDAISVYWRADRKWYDGEVKLIDGVSGICEVLYEDGEREELNLAKERYKIKDGKCQELIDRVLASEGVVSKQLKHIADVIRDIGWRSCLIESFPISFVVWRLMRWLTAPWLEICGVRRETFFLLKYD